MIDVEKQRAECARLQSVCDGVKSDQWTNHQVMQAAANAGWPALIKSHLAALDEIERLRAAGRVLAENCDTRWVSSVNAACRVFEEADGN